MEIYLDPSDRRGVARSIYDQIREAIESGVLAEGDPLPPSRELAGELGVSRHTVTTAYGLLVAEGYLAGRCRWWHRGVPARRWGGGRLTVDRCCVPSRSSPHRRPPSPPPPGGVDLRGGQPDPALFPTDEWRRCASATLHRPLPGYGEPAGFESLRTGARRVDRPVAWRDRRRRPDHRDVRRAGGGPSRRPHDAAAR